jgi:prepilin signal peptidase PulO-like enzyme (type II secretory pathway)
MHQLFSIYALIFGCLIGSFLNVVIYRLPLKKNMVTDRSACPKCGARLSWYHNLPLLSYLFLRGKCAFCGVRISWRYPLIELMTGIISYWLFPDELTGTDLSFFMFYFAMACVFICHFFIDLDHHLLLDSLNLYLLALVLPFAIFTQQWIQWGLGGLIGFGVPLFVTWAFYKIRGPGGLGGGEMKLYGILGILLGPAGIVFNIFLSCFVGALIGLSLIVSKKMSKDRPMAFGPAILLVAVIQIYFPKFSALLQSYFF